LEAGGILRVGECITFCEDRKIVRNSMRDERESRGKRQALFFRERNVIA
jgi:hypothetical protein